MRRLQT
ncbi:hypothetical protein BC937DRAFT_87518, partial [Endogone sp. FLAS-F59071]